MKLTEYLASKWKTLLMIFVIYLLCFIFRLIEYFVIRTDQTFLGEAFIHKLIGIGILIVCLKLFNYSFKDILVKSGKSFYDLLKGLAFGLATFIIAYGVEIIVLVSSNNYKGLDFYVSAYSVDGNIGHQTAFYFYVFCIVGNIINVLMEEGVFRGLFQKMLNIHFKFIPAAIIASIFFGVWHIVGPLRNFTQGDQSFDGFLGQAILLIVTSALVGFKFALMGKLTGSLYMAMGDHFVNNTIINVLHVVSNTESDGLQVLRIAIAQGLSFSIILVLYLIKQNKERNFKKSDESLQEVSEDKEK